MENKDENLCTSTSFKHIISIKLYNLSYDESVAGAALTTVWTEILLKIY